ncbi:alpha/beta hydrolase [Microbacterium marinilacus]|uniref:Alpha/beta hydrolase fold-3 domain-containing protein n=1 Tax=Microbacterium marinilacus TaxID=415209 RepID=A0ABP7BRF3_9MICO|nr:alpha/beta hydrolase [Microbacterium marinilacus]MBY0689181.1 alpha/beta hydrolase [Microbacterium marinilacus]
MPLDPFFADRLQRQRRHMIAQALEGLKRRFGWPWFMRPAEEAAVRSAPAAEKGRARAAARVEVRSKAEADRPRPSTRRAEHRRIALSWDRAELGKVGTPGPDVHTIERVVPVPGHPDVRVRVYYPTVGGRPEAPVPATLTFFGGAFRIGGIDYPTTDAANRRRAADAGVAMVAVDYALAPEHRFPTPVEQGHAALEWLFAHADELGLDAARVGVAGMSAGGNIAAAVALMNRDRGRLPLRLQLLEVPVVDLTGRHIDLGATRGLGIPSLIMVRELRSVASTYLGRRADARHAYASPVRAESLAELPPAVILTAQYDPLRGDGAAYAAALHEAGVDATAVQYLGVTHDTAIFTGVLASARRWHADVVAALRTLHDA